MQRALCLYHFWREILKYIVLQFQQLRCEKGALWADAVSLLQQAAAHAVYTACRCSWMFIHQADSIHGEENQPSIVLFNTAMASELARFEKDLQSANGSQLPLKLKVSVAYCCRLELLELDWATYFTIAHIFVWHTQDTKISTSLYSLNFPPYCRGC